GGRRTLFRGGGLELRRRGPKGCLPEGGCRARRDKVALRAPGRKRLWTRHDLGAGALSRRRDRASACPGCRAGQPAPQPVARAAHGEHGGRSLQAFHSLRQGGRRDGGRWGAAVEKADPACPPGGDLPPARRGALWRAANRRAPGSPRDPARCASPDPGLQRGGIMSRLDLLAVPLSPLHVGEGTEWTPDTFKLEGKELLRFSPQAVAADFAPTQARDFARAVDRGDLKLAQAILQGAVRRQHVRERIALSSASERELGEALRNQHRAGRLHPFVRGSGGPYLPGSAVKGAIRTALLSARVQKELPRFRDWLARQRVQGGRSGQASTELQAQVLGTLDRDPFRFIRVMDAPLPEGRTRIEWIVTRRRDGRRQELQMHF